MPRKPAPTGRNNRQQRPHNGGFPELPDRSGAQRFDNSADTRCDIGKRLVHIGPTCYRFGVGGKSLQMAEFSLPSNLLGAV